MRPGALRKRARSLLGHTRGVRPCPTLGQDNPINPSEILGVDDDANTDLVIAGVIQ